MGELVIEDKKIVVPGDVIARGMDFLPTFGTYRRGDDVVASRLGLVKVDQRVIKLIPLSGKYLPERGDTIIGRVIDITMNGWILDINTAYQAFLSTKDATSDYIRKGADLTEYFTFGDHLVIKVINVTSQKLVDLTLKGPGLCKLEEGIIVHVSPNKVPRIIGTHGSMISMIKHLTQCNVVVGQNGIVWVSGPPKNEVFAIKAIKKIEENVHVSGLTDYIKKFLEQSLPNQPPQRGPMQDTYAGQDTSHSGRDFNHDSNQGVNNE